MAGKSPAFITGATAKVRLGGLTMAYAQDVAYTVTTTTIPIETMGRYEVVSNEPVAYFVEGSLSIIRYTAAAKNMSGASTKGNDPSQWDMVGGGKDGKAKIGSGFTHINPGALLASQTFDLEVYQKQPGKLDDENKPVAVDPILVDKIRDCRLTRKGAGVNKRGVLTDNFAFVGILADVGADASQKASESGDIDLSP